MVQRISYLYFGVGQGLLRLGTRFGVVFKYWTDWVLDEASFPWFLDVGDVRSKRRTLTVGHFNFYLAQI